MLPAGPVAQVMPIAAFEVTVSIKAATPRPQQPVSALGRAAAHDAYEPIYEVFELPFGHARQMPPWLCKPLSSDPDSLARRLELFADGQSRVTRHRGSGWAQAEPELVLGTIGDCAFSPLGREMMKFVARLAEAQSASVEAARTSAELGAVRAARANQAVGAVSLALSGAMMAAVLLGAMGTSLLVASAVGYAAFLLHLCGIDRFERAQRKPGGATLVEQRCQQLCAEAASYRQLLRLDDLVLGGDGESMSELTPAEEAVWSEAKPPYAWFASTLRLLARIGASQSDAPGTQGRGAARASPLLVLAVEELCGKLADGAVREADSYDLREVCRAMSLGLDALYDKPSPSAFERYIEVGLLDGPTDTPRAARASEAP